MKSMFNMVRTKGFWYADSMRTRVNPFPGPYPTRWWLVLSDAKGKSIWKYFGKPNHQLLDKIKSITKIEKAGYKFHYTEFDRGGAFRSGCRWTPTNMYPIDRACGTVCAFYYPASNYMDDFFMGKLSVKHFKLGAYQWFGFSPIVTMNTLEQRARLFDIKVWILKHKGALKLRGWSGRKVEEKRKDVELIELDKLPKLPVDVMKIYYCPSCMRPARVRYAKGATAVCPRCAWSFGVMA